MKMQYQGLDWASLTSEISAKAQSVRAKENCSSLSVFPNEILAIKSVENILQASPLTENNLLPLVIIDSTPMVLERLEKQAVLDIKEIRTLRDFLGVASAQKNLLKEVKNEWCKNVSSKIADFISQMSSIDRVLSPSGEVNESASVELQTFCDERRRLNREVAKTLDLIVRKQQLESVLQDKYVTTREGRLVIPVKSGSQHDLKGLIHDRSQTKQTVFMEPEEVVPLNNKLREIHNQIQEEIYRILKELSEYLSRFNRSFWNADEALLECDVVFAKNMIAKKMSAIDFIFSETKNLLLKDLKHPLLVLQGVDVISNTVHLNFVKRILLLSGPNAGGKTILLKAIGLVSQMARCGLPIPVSPGSELPFFSTVDAVIGDLQSVGENLSSFSSHIGRLNGALKSTGPSHLLLIDEICGATDPEEGAALARSFIENFSEQEIFAVITSHLGPLKENWASDSNVEHGSLEFDNKTNLPTYQLLVGFPGRSLAISVAKRLGVPEKIIERARSFLNPLSLTRTKDLQDIEEVKDQLMDLRRQTQAEVAEAKSKREEYQELVRKFREQRDMWLEKALQKAQKKIENLIEDARLERLKSKTLHEIKAELPEIIKAKPSQIPKIQTIDDFKEFFKPGTPAFLSRLGRQVLVQSEPDQKGQVSVQADSMRLQVPWHHLQMVSAPKNDDLQSVPRRNQSGTFTRMSNQTKASNEVIQTTGEIDLRGRRPDEALELLEKFLDNATLDKLDRIKVIHGFGTEILKRSVRQFLSKSSYVQKWKGGDLSTGGDGITWVELSD
jgi:DNA mismatch repair protein MutS2